MSNLINIKNNITNNKIYKLNYLVDGNINILFVFYGKKVVSENNNELFKEVFTNEEIEKINSENISVKFSEQIIHFDDSIGTIKIKILNELKKVISLEEIYLFCQKIETIHSVSLYQSLTQNKKIELTKIRLDQFLSNIVKEENGENFIRPENKEVYSFDDILNMKIDGKKYVINRVLGQKFFIIENEYPFVCNPYQLTGYDSFFEKSIRKSLSTLNSHLLLNEGQIINNNIYLCLASDVLNYVSTKGISEETTIKVYYPFLYNRNINNLEDLIEKEEELMETNKKILNSKTLNLFKTIDMFYNIYYLRKNELNYIRHGIKYIQFNILPIVEIKIPLEIIFKLIHATEDNPLIKYNPSSRQEKIYRLYTGDKISTDGRKIPFLKKALIFKVMKVIGKTKSVSLYIEHKMRDLTTQSIICEFYENGIIAITSEFINVIDQRELDNLLRETINPIIEEIKNVLENSGYKINKFDSLQNENIEIVKMDYESQIQISKPVHIDQFKGCISSVFNDEKSKNKEFTNLRFKRVSNFNKVTSQEALVFELSDQGYRGNEIIEKLLENFKDDLDRKGAEDIVRKIANELQVERGVKKSDIKIKDNPGFKTTIHVNTKTSTATILVENINNIYYLSTIPIYLDSMIRLTQNKSSTNFPLKEINHLCSSEIKEDMIVFDIISPLESSASESQEEEPIISYEDEDEDVYENEKVDRYFEKEKPKGALSLFFDDEDEEEDDEDDEEEEKGGANTNNEIIFPNSSDSNSSVSTDLGLSDVPIQQEQQEESLQNDSLKESVKVNIKSESTSKSLNSKSLNSESDTESDSESLDSESNSDNEVKNIDGMKLNKPYYFQSLIEKHDPVLILKEDTPEFNAYSRTCSSDTRRQPVILTDSQLKKINKEHNGFLRDEDVIKYGSDPNNKFNYICPRYWCLKNNTIIDPKDLKEVIGKDGKKELIHPTCGKVLSHTDKKVKPGYYIYEFYKPNAKKPKRYPGFQTDKHPDGYCLPCCFDKYNTEGRITAKNKCYGISSKEKEKVEENDEYIKGPDKFPLESGRWGYLPPEMQQILHEVNADCQISKTNTNIKPNHPCLLRHGVEINKKQSFIACISDVIFFAKRVQDENDKTDKIAQVLSIKDMRKRIIKSLTIDNFIKYQNGNLVTNFYNKEGEVEIDKYKSSKLFSKINETNVEEMFYFKKVVSALENFINFLNDDNVMIDHTYLWDLISMPNKYLFPNGVNLVIFQLPKDDITNNVQLLCPTNHYSNEFYEARKPTIIMIKEDEYYEPIYSYTNSNNKLIISKEFKEYDPQLSKTMRSVIKNLIKPFLKTICKPLESIPNVYKAKSPLLLVNLIQKLDKYNYQLIKMVLNFNNKVIGIVVEEPGFLKKRGFVPCYPSAMDEDLKKDIAVVFMTDVSLWNSYNDTVDFLFKLYNRSKKRREEADIPCKPFFKIIEDELVVGILTETNQFIQISEPIAEQDISSENNIPSIKNNNYIVNAREKPLVSIDVPIMTSTKVDNERVDYIKKIKLEANFYNVFRNTIRILLNDYENIQWREKIEKENSNKFIIYSEKLHKIESLLKELVKNKIQFVGDKNFYKLIDDVSTCIVKDENGCSNNKLCALSENETCNLILPEKNLITNKENQPIYFARMADELVRYNRVKNFMFQPQTYLSFGNIGYNLKEDEIIILQSLLTQEYFETLVPGTTNKYIKYNTYDQVEPNLTQIYDAVFDPNKQMEEENEENNENSESCNKIVKSKITSGIWKECFSEKYKEVEYGKYYICTFNFMIDLIEKKINKKLTISEIKNDLYNEYKKYLLDYQNKIVDILMIEGKKTLGDQVKSESLSFSSFIYTDNYFLTTMDIWLLVQKYQIPTIFICQKMILQTDYKKNVFVGFGEEKDDFIFIILPVFKAESIPIFKMVENEEGNCFISINKLNEECLDRIRDAFDNKKSIKEYLQEFTKPKKNIYMKKKLLIIEEEQEDENEKKIEKKKAKKIKIDESPTLSIDELLVIPSKKKSKKKIIIKGKKQTKKNNKNLLIVKSSSPDSS